MSKHVVVDTSVFIAIVMNEPEKSNLVTLTQNVDLIAPLSVKWEMGNAFSAMLKRGRVTVDKAITALAAYQQIPIRVVDIELEEAIKIADQLNIYAYDAYLIRCATKYRAPLLTLDRRLQNSAKSIGVQIIEV